MDGCVFVWVMMLTWSHTKDTQNFMNDLHSEKQGSFRLLESRNYNKFQS